MKTPGDGGQSCLVIFWGGGFHLSFTQKTACISLLGRSGVAVGLDGGGGAGGGGVSTTEVTSFPFLNVIQLVK